jgi:thymidylate synthase
LKGDLYDLSIAKHAAIWRGIVVDGKLNSNYGHYIFRNEQGLAWVIDELRRDRDSRRAYIMILGNQHLNPNEKDVPCTMSLGFRIRDNKLNMSVRMRSQDAIYGMGNDAPAFSFIHQMVWACVKWYYKELEMGSYHHVADSFHVYERHFDMLEKITTPAAEFSLIEVPPIADNYEVNYLLSISSGKPVDYIRNKDYFEFTKWLTSDLPQD